MIVIIIILIKRVMMAGRYGLQIFAVSSTRRVKLRGVITVVRQPAFSFISDRQSYPLA